MRSIANEIWSKVHTNQTARTVLEARGVLPDFEGPKDTDYVHRRAGDTQIYFVRNGRPEAIDAEITLRVKGKAPELWHPDTGRIEDAPSYAVHRRWPDPLAAHPGAEWQRVRSVPSRRNGQEGGRAISTASPSIPVNGPWTVKFTPGWGAPAQATFDKLLSWSEHPDPGIRYYSGTARYTATVDLSPPATGRLIWARSARSPRSGSMASRSEFCGRSPSP